VFVLDLALRGVPDVLGRVHHHDPASEIDSRQMQGAERPLLVGESTPTSPNLVGATTIALASVRS